MSYLTPEEHKLAQVFAYENSLTRGNGVDPPAFDLEASIGDFWQAAGDVIAQRDASAGLLSDGTHRFPIRTLLNVDGDEISGAVGEVCWSPKDGLTYRFELPHASTSDPAPTSFGMTPSPDDGSLSEVSQTPSWSGTLADGGEFMLFSAVGPVNTRHTPVRGQYASRLIRGQYASRLICTGKAALGSIKLPLNHPLAFQHDTPHLRREFLPSFKMLSWPDPEDFSFTDETTHHQRLRNRVIIQTDPHLTVYLGSTTPGSEQGVWLVDEGPSPELERMASRASEDARAFLSFMVGRNLPFYWRDTFVEGTIHRLYMGALRPQIPVLGNEQPVPLYRVREAFTDGVPIGLRLPQLFGRFRQARIDYNLDFVLNPILTALDGYVDDKLAEASVSLERLSTAHADYLKGSGKPRSKAAFLSKKQGAALRETLTKAAKQVAKDEQIPQHVLTIIERKIGNIHQPPNADKLEVVFTDLGLTLRADEQEVLSNRNRALHGRATLSDREDLAAIAEELRRFDVLRTLIHKAILRMLDYTGPYMDYGDHTEGKAYTVKQMNSQATESS